MKHMARPGRRMKPSERMEFASKAKLLWLQGLNPRQVALRIGIDQRLIAKMVKVWERTTP
jgi:transposase